MKLLSTLFLGTLLSIPVLGQLNPDDAIGELSIGTAQMVLSYVAVIEFLAIGLMFSIWRKDISSDRRTDKEHSDLLAKLLAENSVAIAQNADASHRVSKALDGFNVSVLTVDGAINRMSEVIRKCEGKS